MDQFTKWNRLHRCGIRHCLYWGYISLLGEGVLSFENLCPIPLFSNNKICSNHIPGKPLRLDS